jgi:hypothetical protein
MLKRVRKLSFTAAKELIALDIEEMKQREKESGVLTSSHFLYSLFSTSSSLHEVPSPVPSI